jgi:DNA-binding NarL/FixJ family response regulator
MGRSVLVVDDDASFRSLAARILTSWGHDVVGEAGSVDEAMTHTRSLRPDTVLVDIVLPDGTGFGLTTRLLDLPSAPRVVLISSDPDPANGAAAARAGAVGFVPKSELSGPALRRLMAS